MSAGVAVVFRRKFDRPVASDYVDTRLTRQRAHGGATVYSLVTKDVYWGKPTEANYDTAFEQLTQDFISRGLKTLICSPMGCIRDLVRPQHFVKKISQFQQATGASVKIITYNEKAQRTLWMGLSHDEFVDTLRRLIAAEQPVLDSQEEINQQPGQMLPSNPATPQRPSTSSASLPSVLCCDDGQYGENVSVQHDHSSTLQLLPESPHPSAPVHLTTSIPTPTLNYNRALQDPNS
jgi:hypothetical protein